ncbi:MAG: hypothetical protein KGL53_12905, partial [Elusimicrobia bacterium]|nr:hypothetical protein [Elusimicrobiota bacterium]
GPLFDRLCDGEVPLGLPVRVPPERRDSLRSFLAARGAFCPVHWRLTDAAGDDAALSRAELTLPVDQRAEPSDMEALAAAVKEFFGGSS